MNRTTLTALGLLVLRIAIGVTFVMHGAQKLFMDGIPATVEGFTAMGVPMPEIAGPFVGWVELAGGALLMLGLATRLAAALVAGVSAVALFLVHLPAGFFAGDGGIELVFVLTLASIALLLTGPGRLAVDAAFSRRRAAVAA